MWTDNVIVSTLDWGSRGRRFKSGQPDGVNPLVAGGSLTFGGSVALGVGAYRAPNEFISEASFSTASRCIPGNTDE